MPAGLRVFKQCKQACWEQLTFWTVGESKEPKHPLTPRPCPQKSGSVQVASEISSFLWGPQLTALHVYSMTLWTNAQHESRKLQFFSGACKLGPDSWHSPSALDNRSTGSSWGQRPFFPIWGFCSISELNRSDQNFFIFFLNKLLKTLLKLCKQTHKLSS